MFSVRFWGVRGSIPCPGPDTVKYGGNTTCLEIRADERLIIVDFGTGVRSLGRYLIANDLKKRGKIEADVFVTHTHWDHILGFPVFAPAFIPGTVLRITGPISFESDSLEKIIENQLSYHYWPVRAGELAAKIEFNQISETTLDLGGGLTVTSKFLNHTILCLGYRFDYQGKSITAVFDHEPFRNLFSHDPAKEGFDEKEAEEGELAAQAENEKIINFMKDSDIVIHDAQYSEAEYSLHLGWGHASYIHAVSSSISAGVKKLVFFHHDPEHTDKQLKQLEKIYVKKSPVKIMMAKEGMILQA